MKIPVSVLIPTRNEIDNLRSYLMPVVNNFDEVLVVDSGSSDGTPEYAISLGCAVVNFQYNGNWPKKRQWALETFSFRNKWILLLDADELLSDEVVRQIADAIKDQAYDGYWIRFHTAFLGRRMRYGTTSFYKLPLFKHGLAGYEKRLISQDQSMADMEVHEHVVVSSGCVGKIEAPIWDINKNPLDRFLSKHNEYSNWEAAVFLKGNDSELPATPFGTEAQRRRWLKRKLVMIPGSPLLYFTYSYLFKLGFLDGKEGFIYAVFQGIQMFIVKCKIYERRKRAIDSNNAN